MIMSSSVSQSILNQSLFEEDQDFLMPSQVGAAALPNFLANLISLPLGFTTQGDLNTKTLATSLLQPNYPSSLIQPQPSLSIPPKLQFDFLPHLIEPGSNLLPLQKSTPNYWEWGEVGECMSTKRNGGGDDDRLGIATMKMKKMKARRKVREPRFSFKTMSDVDVLDDGYKWRKYGQKVVKNTLHPRSYYRCTQDNCRVKKRVERLVEDPRMVITTYEGRHIHSPSHDDDHYDSNQPNSAQLNNFFSL